MHFTALSDLAIRIFGYFGEFFNYMSTTTLDTMLVWLRDSGFFGWVTAGIIDSFIGILSALVGISTDITLLEFFLGAGITLFAIGWLVQFIQGLINPL